MTVLSEQEKLVEKGKIKCSLCGKIISRWDWLQITLSTSETKYICPDCLWKALLGGYENHRDKLIPRTPPINIGCDGNDYGLQNVYKAKDLKGDDCVE